MKIPSIIKRSPGTSVVIIAIVALAVWYLVTIQIINNEEAIRSHQTFTYEGRVTSVQFMGQGIYSGTTVYLDNNPNGIWIWRNNLQLAIGKIYKLTVDGNMMPISIVLEEN